MSPGKSRARLVVQVLCLVYMAFSFAWIVDVHLSETREITIQIKTPAPADRAPAPKADNGIWV